jgi:hypothetical protein
MKWCWYGHNQYYTFEPRSGQNLSAVNKILFRCGKKKAARKITLRAAFYTLQLSYVKRNLLRLYKDDDLGAPNIAIIGISKSNGFNRL